MSSFKTEKKLMRKDSERSVPGSSLCHGKSSPDCLDQASMVQEELAAPECIEVCKSSTQSEKKIDEELYAEYIPEKMEPFCQAKNMQTSTLEKDSSRPVPGLSEYFPQGDDILTPIIEEGSSYPVYGGNISKKWPQSTCRDSKLTKLVSCMDLTLLQIKQLLKRATLMRNLVLNKGGDNRLNSRVVGLLFVEPLPEAHTKISFAAAMQRLGGTTLELSGYDSYNCITRCESFNDNLNSLCCLCDAIVLKHPQEQFVMSASDFLPIPFINAGSGVEEDPTQALADLYTILSEWGQIGMTITIAGDLLYNTAVHSLVSLLTKLKGDVFFQFVHPPQLWLPLEYASAIERAGLQWVHVESLEAAIIDSDVMYISALEIEKLPLELYPDQVIEWGRQYVVDEAIMALAKPSLVLMSPFPRRSEIDTRVDLDSRAAYHTRQIENGLYIRMSVLECMIPRGRQNSNTYQNQKQKQNHQHRQRKQE
eukprot:GSChrysophyteH1.ASY1.ANO1.2488.1 assembled CDS